MSQLPSSILPFPQNRIPQPGMLRQVPHSGFPGCSGWFSSQTLGRQIQGQARLEQEWAGSVPPSRHDRDRSFPAVPDPLQVPLWVPTAPPCRFQLLLPEIAPSSPLNPSFPSPGPTPWSSPTPQFPPHPSIHRYSFNPGFNAGPLGCSRSLMALKFPFGKLRSINLTLSGMFAARAEPPQAPASPAALPSREQLLPKHGSGFTDSWQFQRVQRHEPEAVTRSCHPLLSPAPVTRSCHPCQAPGGGAELTNPGCCSNLRLFYSTHHCNK